jgi:hypothetical protein
MADLLFDAAWWVPLFVAAVGIGLFVSANRRQQEKLRLAGAGIFGLAILLVVLKFTVDTPKKASARMTREFVAAVVSGDSAKLESLLESRATLRVLTFPAMYTDSGQISRAAHEEAARIHLKEAHVRSLNVERTGPMITVTIDIITEQEEAAAPVVDSEWQFDYEEISAGWRIREIRAIKIGSLGTEEMEGVLPRR